MPVRGFLVLIGIALAAGAGWYFALHGGALKSIRESVAGAITSPGAPVSGGAAKAPAAPGAAAEDEALITGVHIDAAGRAVISGTAAPGEEVSVLKDRKPLGTARAGAGGAWTLAAKHPLGAGARLLTLSGADAAGAAGEVIADIRAGGESPLVVRQRPHAATVVLQQPDDQGAGALRAEVVDFFAGGSALISGHAEAGKSVRVYLDNDPAGLATADGAGAWVLKAGPIAPGIYTMRLDELGPKGTVAARIELGLESPDMDIAAHALLALTPIAVEETSDEWHIARRLSGTELRYTLVYRTEGQSRDPKLIYPGQIFEEPGSARP